VFRAYLGGLTALDLSVDEIASRTGLPVDVVPPMQIARLGLRGEAHRLLRAGCTLTWT